MLYMNIFLFNENPVIYVDKNQQRGKHDNIDSYLKENNIKAIRKKLPTGDYVLDLNNSEIYIDTKKDWDELGKNLFGKKKQNFIDEIERADKENKPLIILIEEEKELNKWKNPRSDRCFTYNWKSIKNRINELCAIYPKLYFLNCSRKSTPKLLLGFLTGQIDFDENSDKQKEQDEFFEWLMETYPDGLPNSETL